MEDTGQALTPKRAFPGKLSEELKQTEVNRKEVLDLIDSVTHSGGLGLLGLLDPWGGALHRFPPDRP